MFEKVRARKDKAHPLFPATSPKRPAPTGTSINYLIGRDGQVVDYYSSLTSALSVKLIAAIERLL